MTPRVSVILPLHNRADVLARAIGSVLEQELHDLELIIIDDGSTDKSAGVVQSFKDDRIRLIRLEHKRGANIARNEGIGAARAELIAFLDSDDRYLPNKLAWTLAEFERRPELDLIVDSFIKIGAPDARRKEQVRRNPIIEDCALFRTALFTRQLWKATPSITVRRDVAITAGMFDETLGRLQDLDFLIRASRFAKCASTNEVLWVKYWDPNAISGEDNMIPANVELVRRHPEYLRTSAYRPGLAYALRLSTWRRIKSRDFGGILRDVRDLAQAFGSLETARLAWEALWPRRAAG